MGYDQFAARIKFALLPLMADRLCRRRVRGIAKVPALDTDGAPIMLVL